MEKKKKKNLKSFKESKGLGLKIAKKKSSLEQERGREAEVLQQDKECFLLVWGFFSFLLQTRWKVGCKLPLSSQLQ